MGITVIPETDKTFRSLPAAFLIYTPEKHPDLRCDDHNRQIDKQARYRPPTVLVKVKDKTSQSVSPVFPVGCVLITARISIGLVLI